MHDVDAILIPLKQHLKIVCEIGVMTEKMQFSVAYASEKKNSNTVSSLHRLCIVSTSCYRTYIATKKVKKM